MKLLMITGDRALAAGKRASFYNTLEGLHTHFERIDIICPQSQAARFEMSVFGNVFVHPSPWPLFLQWFWILRKGLKIIRQYKPALMTVHEYSPVFNGVGVRFLRRLTGVPYILEVMHVPGVPRSASLWESFNRFLTRVFIAWEARPARAVRVINQSETPEFLVGAGVPREKIEHIPAFYIDLEIFKPQEASKQYDLVFVGRLARNKGIELFLDVVRLSGLSALIIGEGPLLASAKSKVKNENLKVNFQGYARDSLEVAELINRSRLLLMTSLNEGGPRVVLEALACGVPVVATPIGIVPDVLPPECIEEWNVVDIVAKVKNLLGDQELYQRVREAGLFTVKKFERSNAIAVYATRLKEIAERS